MPDAVVVGAGVAGLACARELHAAGLDVLVLEAGTVAGGRVRTDVVDGFLLDRGFQVLLTAYPEARRVLDYERLSTSAVRPRCDRPAREPLPRLSDPWRPARARVASLLTAGRRSLADACAWRGFADASRRGSLEEISGGPSRPPPRGCTPRASRPA